MKNSMKVKKSNSFKHIEGYIEARSKKNRRIYEDLDELTEKFLGRNRSLMEQFASIQKNMRKEARSSKLYSCSYFLSFVS